MLSSSRSLTAASGSSRSRARSAPDWANLPPGPPGALPTRARPRSRCSSRSGPGPDQPRPGSRGSPARRRRPSAVLDPEPLADLGRGLRQLVHQDAVEGVNRERLALVGVDRDDRIRTALEAGALADRDYAPNTSRSPASGRHAWRNPPPARRLWLSRSCGSCGDPLLGAGGQAGVVRCSRCRTGGRQIVVTPSRPPGTAPRSAYRGRERSQFAVLIGGTARLPPVG